LLINYLLLTILVLYCHMGEKFKLVLIALILGYQTASAQLVVENFGSGANAFTMEFVTIGNPGNAADTTGSPNPAGSVAYTYNLAKYEVSRDQITKANSAGSLGITLAEMGSYGGNGLLKPATGVSWYEAAKYVNYLNTSTGGTAAYKFNGSGTFQLWSSTDEGYNANNLFRNSLAKFVIANSNEWYKGAYGNPNGSWSNFPNGSNSAPTAVASGTATNTAVYGQSVSTGPANITSAGGLSAYGTMGQGGNVVEYTETANDGSNDIANEYRELRGGAWYEASSLLGPSSRMAGHVLDPTYENSSYGFRVASVPEPSALSLLAIGLSGLALVRRRKQS
jgi:formylglycine-generating enzyme required for sulfatase activity